MTNYKYKKKKRDNALCHHRRVESDITATTATHQHTAIAKRHHKRHRTITLKEHLLELKIARLETENAVLRFMTSKSIVNNFNCPVGVGEVKINTLISSGRPHT